MNYERDNVQKLDQMTSQHEWGEAVKSSKKMSLKLALSRTIFTLHTQFMHQNFITVLDIFVLFQMMCPFKQ